MKSQPRVIGQFHWAHILLVSNNSSGPVSKKLFFSLTFHFLCMFVFFLSCTIQILNTDSPLPSLYATKWPRTQASQVVQVVKNPLPMEETQETWVQSLATHSSILAWRIPWTEEPGGLWPMGSQRVGHDWSDLAQHSTSPHRGICVCAKLLSTERGWDK